LVLSFVGGGGGGGAARPPTRDHVQDETRHVTEVMDS
jgi:hypothetical protein